MSSPTTRYTDSPAAERPIQPHKWLGEDGEGYHHHLDRQTEAIHRIHPDGTRERRTELREFVSASMPLEAAVSTYVLDFVASEVGWRDRIPATREVFCDHWGLAHGPFRPLRIPFLYLGPFGSLSHAPCQRRSPP